MRFVLALAAAISFFAPVAQAQTPQTPVSGPCADLAKALGFIEATKKTRFQDGDGACSITQFYVSFGSYIRYRIDEAIVRSPELFTGDVDLKNAVGGFILPTELDISVTGFVLAPETGSALNDYIIETQSEPLDLHLAYRWDRDTGALNLADLGVRTRDGSAITMAAMASDVALTQEHLDKLEALPGGIEQLIFSVEDASFFASLVSPALLGMLPDDGDPRALVASYQKVAVTLIDSLPGDSVSNNSKAALRDFVESFPKPTGDYTVQLRADPPIPFVSLQPSDISELLGLLATTELTVTHTPEE
ncbi:hypothetical protein [Devosia sp. Leaf64]|uniref:hypothetical protein n=1 Tax=Devosia sp. Leaf64 TaxID=1736229 RepID=UPI00071334CF|nr:hypothetical protein [Devosia sp. Leaf64]KQN73843.1 hypothetical protein ASE94_06275 [Devosia sp. Leaf64]